MEDAEIAIEGYNILSRCDRQDTTSGRGGGVIAYVKKEILATEMNSKFDEVCQAKMLEINCGGVKYHFVNVYRPPSTTQENILKLNEAIKSIKGITVILGDFNFPEIDWNTVTTTNSRSQDFLNATQDVFLHQLINFHTRPTSELTKGNILDLLMCNYPEKIENVEDIGPIGNSDHTCIKFEILTTTPKIKSVQLVPDFQKANFNEMREEMESLDWNDFLKGKETEDMWNAFKQKLEDLTSKFIPFKQRRASNKTPWCNNETKRIVKIKQKKYRTMKETQSKEDIQEFKKSQKQAKKLVRNARKKYEKNLAKNFKNNPKAFYSYISKNTKTKTSIGPLKDGDSETQNDAEMCDVLNKFFASVFTIDDGSELPQFEKVYNGETPLKNITISTEDVIKAIGKLSPDTAPGPDNIYSRTLKELVNQVAQPLAMIYNSSLQSGVVVADWKLANVTPVFKKGCKSTASNYRPISLTSVPGKLMERILQWAILDHLINNNLINQTQHGFLPKKSTVSNLIEYMDVITKILDFGQPVDSIYIDFAKCFDKISHRHLLYKVNKYGIEDRIFDWLTNWLTNRKQRVCINGLSSEWIDVSSSVIQGSILGPILFIIFSNDIDYVLKNSNISKFADDSKVFAKVETSDDCVCLQSDLDRVFEWSVKWKMEINKEKCHVLHFGSSNKRMTYMFGGKVLESVDEERDLGVQISSTGKPHSQCSKASKKGNQVLGQLCRNIISKDKVTFTKLYKTYVRPHLEYAIQAWNPWNAADIEMLEKVQRRATRQIPGIGKLEYVERLKCLGLTTLQDRRKRGDLIEVFKMLNGITNVQNDQLFEMRDGVQLTRGNICLNLFKRHTRLEVRRHFFTERVINDWNQLPLEVKTAEDTQTFKINYDKFYESKKKMED